MAIVPRWECTAPDGTRTRHKTFRAALDAAEQGSSIKRVSVALSRGPQKRAPAAREDQPPVVPARRAPDPAPQPGQRIDANGNVVRDKR